MISQEPTEYTDQSEADACGKRSKRLTRVSGCRKEESVWLVYLEVLQRENPQGNHSTQPEHQKRQHEQGPSTEGDSVVTHETSAAQWEMQ